MLIIIFTIASFLLLLTDLTLNISLNNSTLMEPNESNMTTTIEMSVKPTNEVDKDVNVAVTLLIAANGTSTSGTITKYCS